MTGPSPEAWAGAFAEQSRSDWEVYQRLAAIEDIPTCHRLHYLQMACEKIAKAYRLRDTSADVDLLLSSHVGFDKAVGAWLASPEMKRDYAGRAAQLRAVTREARLLARAIERLAPSVNATASPENAEYPWANGDQVLVPSRYDFPTFSLLTAAGGRNFLKLVGRAIAGFVSP